MSDEETICGTHVKIGDIRNDICKQTGVQSALCKWSAAEVGAGKGFLSVMAKMSFEWAERNEKLPNGAILKIPTIDKIKMVMPVDEHGHSDIVESVKIDLYKIHNCEISVYEAFGDQPPTAIPKMWSVKRLSEHGLETNESAYILMEDLSQRCTHWDLTSCEKLTFNQTKAVIVELAKVHSWSLTCPERCQLIEAKSNGMTDFLEKTTGDFEASKIKFKAALATKRWMDKLGEQALAQQTDITDCGIEEHIEKMSTINLRHSIPNTLCHGDVHVNNMFFVKDTDGKPSDYFRALIDWQLVNIGNPLEDLCRLLNWLGPLDTRLSFADREALLQLYYEQFTKSMKQTDQSMPFTFDQLKAAFWETSVTFGRWLVIMSSGFVQQIESGAVPGVDAITGADKMMDDLVLMFKDVLYIKNGKHL